LVYLTPRHIAISGDEWEIKQALCPTVLDTVAVM
jgi:hypothetical protein